MNNEEILKLAEEKFDMTVDERCRVTYTTDNYGATAFYRAAFNQGLEAAARECVLLREIFPDFGEYCKGGLAGLETAEKHIKELRK